MRMSNEHVKLNLDTGIRNYQGEVAAKPENMQKTLVYMQTSNDGAKKLIREDITEDDIEDLIGFFIKEVSSYEYIRSDSARHSPLMELLTQTSLII